MAIATSAIDLSGRVVTSNTNPVVGVLGRIVGRGPRDVAEELTLAAGSTYEVTVTLPLTVQVPISE